MGRFFLQRQWQVCENWVPLDVFFFGVFVGYGCSSPFISFHKGGTGTYPSFIPPGKDRWRNSHVLVYHGPVSQATFWEV